jgi:hypothetical protein
MPNNRITEAINLAFLAIGGRERNETFCQCDPSVGMSPCQYCAEYDALELFSGMAIENDKLRQAIREYADHLDNCRGYGGAVGCSCGFGEAYNALVRGK